MENSKCVVPIFEKDDHCSNETISTQICCVSNNVTTQIVIRSDQCKLVFSNNIVRVTIIKIQLAILK